MVISTEKHLSGSLIYANHIFANLSSSEVEVKEGKTIIFTTHNPNHLINLDCDIYAVKEQTIEKTDQLSLDTIRKLYGDEFEQEGKTFVFKI